MKIVRSKGQSFTSPHGLKGQLARGLKIQNTQAKTEVIEPGQLTQFIVSDRDLAMRQLVSALDKVIKKRPLRNYNVEAYVDRVRIAAHLWKMLTPHLALTPESIELAKRTWNSRVHSSYAKWEIDYAAPKSDRNAREIERNSEPNQIAFVGDVSNGSAVVTREMLRGAWHAAMWRSSHEATAKSIFDHVFTQEMLIRESTKAHPETHRKSAKTGGASGMGLAAARAGTIVTSAKDPRSTRATVIDNVEGWREEDALIYFRKLPLIDGGTRLVDVAERVIFTLNDSVERNAAELGALIGKAIYAHFGALRGTYETEKDKFTVLHLLHLHNAVRSYYADLAASQKLRIAFDPKLRERVRVSRLQNGGSDPDSGGGFLRLLPADASALRRALDAIDDNREISRWVRLGRLVAHAADADDSASLSQAEFDRRLNYFATSDGQSQIKRNETFARIWRSASALSFRTMKAWADPHNQAVLVETMKDGRKRSNRDLAQARVAKIAKDKLSLPHFEAFSEVIFGNRLINERSRSEIFVGPGGDPDTAREGIWAFLRLGAAMRNGISHLVTKPRLARIISSGLAASDIPKGVEVSFGQLLAFDKMLRRHMIAQEIERLQIAHYATNEQLDEIIRQFGKLPANEPVALPRFMSVLGRVAKLAQHVERKQDNNSEIQLQYTLPDELKGLASVKIDLETQTGRGAESCTLGGLRHLYETGFRNWLATDELSEMCVKDTLTLLAQIKESRVKSYQAEKGLYFAPDDSILQTLLKEGYSKLPEIFEQLDARASQLQRDFDRFKSDRKAQQQKSNWIDDFKRELFAHLFAKYVKEQGFDWLYALKESSPVVDAGPFDESRIDLPELELAPWHGRFYAWLYLLPLSEISKLRHQMIKSRVLEIRGSDQPQKSELKVLEHADMLMALQLSVRDAGYSGTEHQKLLDLSMDKENQRKGNEFYNSVFGKDGVFTRLMSVEAEDQSFSLTGTRRSLREMLRLGNAGILGSIFKHHPLDQDEFALIESKDQRRRGGILTRERDDLKKELVEARRLWTPKAAVSDAEMTPSLRSLAKRYQTAASSAAIHAFTARGARLGDHLALHDLMMRISARLVDYAWLWERDRAYVYLGMLWDKMGGRLEIATPEGEPKSTVAVKTSNDGTFILWRAEGGFATAKFSLDNLSPEHAAIFKHHFFHRDENPKDRKRIAELKVEKKEFHEPQVALGLQRIRNDLAHYNFLSFANPKDDRQATSERVISRAPNFGYLVNAVRSLVSYDRKLKNAVVKSIADIVEDDGLQISWTLEHDRLHDSRVAPQLMDHLEFLPRELDDCRFSLPKASARYASMVKALFDHDHGGNRERVPTGKVDNGAKVYEARGGLSYPKYRPECRVTEEFRKWRAYEKAGRS